MKFNANVAVLDLCLFYIIRKKVGSSYKILFMAEQFSNDRAKAEINVLNKFHNNFFLCKW